MKDFLKQSWKYLVPLLLGIFIGLMINIPSCSQQSTIIKVPVHDTITVDSIRIQEKIEWKYRTITDTVVAYVSDTDTVYLPIQIPIDHYVYNDTISTDSTSTELQIAYEGWRAKIDSVSLIHNYFYTKEIIPAKEKLVSPFIGLEAGPVVNYNFSEVKGAAIEAEAGILFRNGWGGKVSYELDALNSGIEHSVKLGVVKKW